MTNIIFITGPPRFECGATQVVTAGTGLRDCGQTPGIVLSCRVHAEASLLIRHDCQSYQTEWISEQVMIERAPDQKRKGKAIVIPGAVRQTPHQRGNKEHAQDSIVRHKAQIKVV